MVSIKEHRLYSSKQKQTVRDCFYFDYLFVVGETSHDCRVHNPIQQHGEWVYGKVGITEMPLHHAADLLIGQLHRLHGDLQRADLLLCSPQSVVVTR